MNPIRILHLEDSSRDAEMIQDKLEAEGLVCDIVHVDNRERFAAALADGSFDVILCDYNLPDYDGVSALKLAREKHPVTPVMLISGSLGEEEAVKCLHHGATDYLLKGRLERLPTAVKRALEDAELHRQRREAEENLRKLSRVAEQTADHVIITNAAGTIEYVNPAFEQATGYSLAEAVGRTPRLLKSGNHPPGFYTALWKTLLEGRVFRAEFINRRKDGQIFIEDKTITPLTDAGGRITHYVSSGRDVTERKRTEEALRKSHEAFRRAIEDIFRFVPEALLVFTNRLNLFRHNKAFEDLLRTYAPKLDYTEAELSELILREIRANVLTGDRGEIRIPPKRRDGKGTRGTDHSGEGAEPAAPQIPGLS